MKTCLGGLLFSRTRCSMCLFCPIDALYCVCVLRLLFSLLSGIMNSSNNNHAQ